MTQVNCPKCGEAFDVSAIAHIPDSQSLSMRLTFDSELLCAKTLGNAIVNMDKLQKAIAKEVGLKTATFIESITTASHSVEIRFRILPLKPLSTDHETTHQPH